ncbi:MAG: type II toxin-antitoxin system VapC family toxin [Leptospiraceae bacterium]|nr:type II toxin-antitoxin system VapC family toxin [Leptospiraceae bacterium]
MNHILIDTDILIDVTRKKESAIVFLENLEKDYILSISYITRMELLVGCKNKLEQEKILKAMSDFAIFDINNKTTIIAEQLLISHHLSHGLLIPDSIIAATAIEANITLCSKNYKDFQFIKELSFIPYKEKQ